MAIYSIRETKFGFITAIGFMGDPNLIELIEFQKEGHDHVHDKFEHAVCLKGTCQIIINGKVSVAKINEVFTIPPNVPHRMKPLTIPSYWLLWYSDQ